MFSFLRRKKKSDESQNAESQVESQLENQDISPSSESNPETTDTVSKELVELSQAEFANEVIIEPKEAEPTETVPTMVDAPKPVEVQSIDSQTEILVNIETTPEKTPEPIAEEKPQKIGFFTRLKQGLSKTRQSFTESIASLVLGRKEIDDDLLDDLEMILLTADVGVEATDRIIRNLTDQVSRKELKDPEALLTSLKSQLQTIVEPISQPLEIDVHLAKKEGPYVILMVGINGVGKTTTIGKLAKKFQNEGKSVMLAAGDTFRAAAVEQLQTWGERNHVPVIAQKTGADSAAVIFDAIQSAKAKNIDVLIADTAGRLHTQSNLMEELKKVKRVITKVDDSAPHEVMLVIDAGTGQNALNQADQFQKAVGVTGITLTKLDGTAKGGIVFALAEQLSIPVRFIGVGESIDDLRPFQAKEFTEALFDQSQS